MPELPEVETTKRGISPHISGKTLTQAIVREQRLRWPVSDLTPAINQPLQDISRRSKYLRLKFSSGEVMIHLGMSGKLRVLTHEQAKTTKKHDHVDLIFDDTVIRYNDPRRFGAILWNPQGDQHPLLAKLGPEPSTPAYNSQYLFDACQKSRRAIKQVLMDSHIVVGVGNIYACESLFLAEIHPATPANQLSQTQCQALCQHSKATLKKAIKAGGTTLKDFMQSDGKPGYFSQKLHVYGREGETCPRACNGHIKNIRLSNRSSFYCPQCQPLDLTT